MEVDTEGDSDGRQSGGGQRKKEKGGVTDVGETKKWGSERQTDRQTQGHRMKKSRREREVNRQ